MLACDHPRQRKIDVVRIIFGGELARLTGHLITGDLLPSGRIPDKIRVRYYLNRNKFVATGKTHHSGTAVVLLD